MGRESIGIPLTFELVHNPAVEFAEGPGRYVSTFSTRIPMKWMTQAQALLANNINLVKLLLIPFNLASIWIAVNNRQNNIDYGELEFADFIGLKYMVCVCAVSAGYALFAAVSSWLRCLVTKAWIFFVADQV
ncbi:UNVERIFIED_CONTAM: CASP-like protein 2D1 [Sesamum angustifolium]|uniref:CASP-like protein n=1 Tax=Sesamum angustifolium TaxID=2727405 RepID=A0AAW2KVF7_9LAMI